MIRRNIPNIYTRTRFKTQSRYCIPYTAATKTRNYVIKDHLVDVLKIQKISTNKIKKPTNSNSTLLQESGNIFETNVIQYINDHIHKVRFVSDTITPQSCKKTIEYMEKGYPFIHSAPVRNDDNRTHGIIDLLVRSDYLNKLIDDCPLTDKDLVKPSVFSNKFHYLVIDIKFCTIPLASNRINILNSGNFPAYKSQLFVYNEAIGLIQNYISRYAFILGRNWNCNKGEGNVSNSCLNKLGTIDFKEYDRQYIETTIKAIAWVEDVYKNGHSWSTNPPSKPELYPNMCKDSYEWNKEKTNIATDINEITCVWNCGVKQRNHAFEHGVTNWTDNRLNSSLMGMSKDSNKGKIIDAILSINQQQTDLIRPNKIQSNMFDWKNTHTNELFVDFETISDIFNNCDKITDTKSVNTIFMIGVGFIDINNKWQYKQFLCNKPSMEEEFKIMNDFQNFIKSFNDTKIFFWSAEKNFWNQSVKKQLSAENQNIISSWKIDNWYDLSYLFKQEPIVVKNCLNFKLKSIAKSMKNNKLINTELKSECTNGLQAQTFAWKYYNLIQNDDVRTTIINDISVYNEFDCKILYDLIIYLRTNHI